MLDWHPDEYQQAWAFATRAHGSQTYGGSLPGEQIPYINHLASVAAEVMWAIQAEAEGGFRRQTRLALHCALLHDTLEDTAVTEAELEAEFGALVLAGVRALSKNPALPKEQQLPDSLQRILQLPQEIAMVKLADRITNLYCPPFYWDNTKILSYQREAEQILLTLGHVSGILAARLQQKIEEYPRFLR